MEAINLPLYQRIARQLKSAIERGELTPGSRLPASRVYAQEQGVSRATIENAWGELVAQGWLERRGQAGTFVSERLSPRQLAPVPPVQPAAPTEPLPFQMGLPALDLFPRGQWARVMSVGCGRSRGSILHPAIPAAIRFCARLSSIIYACRAVSTVSRIRC